MEIIQARRPQEIYVTDEADTHAIEQYQKHLSPVHDDLAETYAGSEEFFRLVPLKANEP
ncbi:MAG TPA: hypothetical protein VJ783_14145 [Pirellulales bacterium]|nr:hypothetical protein [Pirellulales bacterium]